MPLKSDTTLYAVLVINYLYINIRNTSKITNINKVGLHYKVNLKYFLYLLQIFIKL